MQKLRLLYRYLLYLIQSTNTHGVHSPFVFDLVRNVIYTKKYFYAFNEINRMRRNMLESEREISIVDFGAGSLHGNESIKKISGIAKHAAKSEKYGELLFRLVNEFKPKTILEFGTSLGISAMYLASARRQTKVVTIEGCCEIAQIAQNNFNEMNLKNITLLEGTFEELMDAAFQKLKTLDFVFFDGNHRKEPTLDYFKKCLKYSNCESVFVFDDIHWSKEMEATWKEIINHPQVTVSIDLFFLGLVFFRKEQAKEHFIVRF